MDMIVNTIYTVVSPPSNASGIQVEAHFTSASPKRYVNEKIPERSEFDFEIDRVVAVEYRLADACRKLPSAVHRKPALKPPTTDPTIAPT